MDKKARFCVRCGKVTSNLVNSHCPECYLSQHKISVPRKIIITTCPKCGTVKWRGIWIKSSEPLEFYIVHAIAEKIKLPEGISVKNIEILEIGNEGEINVALKVGKTKITEHHKINIQIKKQQCKDCQAQGAQKYLAKVQFRSNNELKVEKAINHSNNYKKYILKIEELKTGADFHFNNKEIGKKFAREINKDLKGRLKETSEQYSWDKSKNRPKYRLVLLVKS